MTAAAPAPIIALLTDFGSRDWYVGTMKGAILRHCPQAILVDIAHNIPAGDIGGAAFALSQCWLEFPSGTHFLVVIDPGVGTARKPAAIRAQDQVLVGPDNGLFGFLDPYEAREISSPTFMAEQCSNTFHGRDIFAPAVARLAAGAAFETVGDPIDALHPTPWPEVLYEKRGATGKIITFDHYGNAITNLHRDRVIAHYPIGQLHVSLHPDRMPLAKTFADVRPGAPVAYFGSGGYLELAVNGGSAEATLALRRGQTVELLL